MIIGWNQFDRGRRCPLMASQRYAEEHRDSSIQRSALGGTMFTKPTAPATGTGTPPKSQGNKCRTLIRLGRRFGARFH